MCLLFRLVWRALVGFQFLYIYLYIFILFRTFCNQCDLVCVSFWQRLWDFFDSEKYFWHFASVHFIRLIPNFNFDRKPLPNLLVTPKIPIVYVSRIKLSAVIFLLIRNGFWFVETSAFCINEKFHAFYCMKIYSKDPSNTIYYKVSFNFEKNKTRMATFFNGNFVYDFRQNILWPVMTQNLAEYYSNMIVCFVNYKNALDNSSIWPHNQSQSSSNIIICLYSVNIELMVIKWF